MEFISPCRLLRHNGQAPLLLKPRPQLPTGRCNIISTLGTYTITDTTIKQSIAERANSIRSRRPITGGSCVDGNAIDMGKLLQGYEQLCKLLGMRWRVIHTRK